uniref:Uncharacterized protein n=1 Tax=Rhizophora mucronata TaxID=61149 RepID=A0A2P2JMG1_RHIMU
MERRVLGMELALLKTQHCHPSLSPSHLGSSKLRQSLL